jgi:hypothetical protein
VKAVSGDGNCFLTSIINSAKHEIKKRVDENGYAERLAALDELTTDSLRQEITHFLKSHLSSR